MRTFIFLLCSTAFAFSPKNSFSQNAKIVIGSEKNVSVQYVFELISNQTNYQFVYDNNLLKNAPLVSLKKGTIKTNELLKKSLNPISCSYDFVDNTVIVTKKISVSQQQSFEINGTVTDEKGEPLPGMTVYVSSLKPTQRQPPKKDFIIRGTATDFDGKFKLKVKLNSYLIVSGIGYSHHHQKITSTQKEYKITLKEMLNKLDEVVIVGYGKTVKKDLTGSVATIKATEIAKIKSQTIDQALVGKMPGVYVSGNGGAPGSGATINIRGLSQLIGDNQPLYVVDGVPIVVNPRFGDLGSIGVFGNRENPLLAINPSDVENISVLKDASAAAIYGSRAANGVVIITTKRGKRMQSPQFTFSVDATIQNPTKKHNLLNATQFLELAKKHNATLNPEANTVNTDWQNQLIKSNALWTQYNFGVQGGSENANYFISGTASDQDGVIINNNFKRYNFSASTDVNISPKFKTGASVNYNYSINKKSALQGLANVFWRPDQPIHDKDGAFTTRPSYLGKVRNPLGNEVDVKNKAISQNIYGTLYGEYKILKGLTFKSELSIGLNNDKTSIFSPSYTSSAKNATSSSGVTGATLANQRNDSRSTSFANTLTYNAVIAEKHRVNTVIGLSYDQSRLDLESQNYQGFPDDKVLTNINSATKVTGHRSDVSQNALNSAFGRINYNYDNRYLVTFTARRDKSIKFGPGNQVGFFPSGALAWNMHNEEFLKNNKLISQLKLRASLGRTGSDNLPEFSYLAALKSLGNNDSYYDGINGIAVPSIPNDFIRWESTDQLDLAVEFGLLNGKINGEIVYFDKKTSDIILLTPVPAETGQERYNANIADVSNNGWEIAIGSDIFRNKNFTWNSSFNISFIKNNVEALNGGEASSFGNRGIKEGQPVGVIEGYEVVSIAQTQEEIDKLNANAPDGNYYSTLMQPGDYIYKDINGDGEITEEDVVPLGDINPDFFGGWNNQFSYKNFEASFSLQFVSGNKREWNRINALGNNRFEQNYTNIIYDTWLPDNTQATYARLGSGTHFSGNETTSKSVVDGSYMRLRSASVSYNFPKKIIKSAGFKSLKLTLSGNNLITITNYPGIDPESVSPARGGSTVNLTRDEGDAYPQVKSVSIGLKVGF